MRVTGTPTRVDYGEHPGQFGELSLPEGPPLGVVVVIHGGFWKARYDLALGRPLAASLARHGWAAWNLEYRRVGEGVPGGGGGTPATFDDVAAGIDALARTGLDLGTVLTLGHSAGGHLATWAAARQRYPEWSGGVTVTGVVSQAGVLDLRAAHAAGLGDGAVAGLLGHAPTDADDRYDPARQVPLEVPVRCVHASGDTDVPLSQSAGYVTSARAAGGDAVLVEVEGDHFTVIDPTSTAWARTLDVLGALRRR